MEKSDGTAEKSKRIGKAAPLSAGRQTAAGTVNQKENYE